MFEKINKWYILGLWTADMVQRAVEKGLLTDEQCSAILAEEV